MADEKENNSDDADDLSFTEDDLNDENLSEEEREIIKQQMAIMAEADEQDDADSEKPADSDEDELNDENLSDEEREIIKQQMAIMAEADEEEQAEQAQVEEEEKDEEEAKEEETQDAAPEEEGPKLSLQEVIAKQKEEMQAKASDGGDSDEKSAPDEKTEQGSGGPSLQDIIAAQKAKMGAKTQDETGEPAGESTEGAEENAEAAEGESGDYESAAASAGSGKRSPVFQFAMLVNTVLISLSVGLLLYMFSAGPRESSAIPVQIVTVSHPEDAPALAKPETPAPKTVFWSDAEDDYKNKRYRQAFAGFQQLISSASGGGLDNLVKDFFVLRAGQCLYRMEKVKPAKVLLSESANSTSPMVRAAAFYDLAVCDVKSGQYMQGRMKAYRCLAALGSLTEPVALEMDCDFLIARALTGEVLSYHNSDVSIPWRPLRSGDLFEGMSDSTIRETLQQGVGRFNDAVLGPVVWKVGGGSAGHRWVVACSRAKLEEMLKRFSAAAKVDVKWVGVDPRVRQRAVTLCLSGVSEQRFGEITCGLSGLLARFTGEQIMVYNPQAADSIAEQRELIVREAISAWRRFFLRARHDVRVTDGHFALGGIYEASGQKAQAMQEYRFTSKRFAQDKLAPHALLRSAKLRFALRDYAGARQELLDLLDGYPQFSSTDQIYLSLGRSSWEVGSKDHAVRTLKKLYYLNLTAESRVHACFEVGKCYHHMGDHKAAVGWLTDFSKIAKETTGEQFARAMFLLGKSQAVSGDMSNAIKNLHRSLNAKPPGKLHVEVAMQLAEFYMQDDNLGRSMGILEYIDNNKMTNLQLWKHTLLTAKVYRRMGLPLLCRDLLAKSIPTVFNDGVRIEMYMEMVEGYQDMDMPDQARMVMAELLSRMSPGPRADRVRCGLAELCLACGQPKQAIVVATQAFDSTGDREIRDKARRILARAYILQEDYQEAAEVLKRNLSDLIGANSK